MGKQQASAAQGRGLCDDVPDRKGRAERIAPVMGQVQATGLIVQMGDEQTLLRAVAILETACKEASGRAAVAHLQGWFGTLKMHSLLLSP